MEDKEHTLSKLSEMFNEIAVMSIRNVCEQHSYDVGKCIDSLMNIKNRKNSNEATKENTNPTQFHGAIPKKYNFNANTTMVTTTMPQRARNSNSTYRNNNNNNQKITDIEQRIAEDIIAGYRIMVLMRGAPGSGKTTQAKALVERCVPLHGEYTLKEFVLSSDDYFVGPNGRYKYNVELLSDAHNFNHSRVRHKAEAGWSPIIVDNTNMKLWEMQSYVQVAVQNGYKIEILEPKTPWRNSAGKLAMKNIHNVPREKIKAMLDKYEKGNVGDLLKMMKQTKYTMSMPQMRVHPPLAIMTTQQDIETDEKFQIFQDSAEVTWNLPAPKAQRDNTRRTMLTRAPAEAEFERQQLIPEITETAWKTFEEEQMNFWGIEQQLPQVNTEINESKKTLLDLMREDVNELQPDFASKSTVKTNEEDSTTQLSQYNTFQRHSTNCRNEHPAFVSLRQIYPNKEVASLWDLFVKCNGDIDWAVDILLKEDELSLGNTNEDYSLMQENHSDAFICDCDNKNVSLNSSALLGDVATAAQEQKLEVPLNVGIKPQRQRNRAPNLPIELQEIKEKIENRFVLGDEHYSNHIRRLRDFRNDNGSASAAINNRPQRHGTDAETQTEPIYEEQEEDSKELVEISLEENLVKQLNDIFKVETVLTEQLPDKINANVFMPRALAKELYMLWVESAYNQIEEQRQQTLREDENFARLLKNPKYENFMESPSNARELLDMEMAWLIYNGQREQQEEALRQKPADLAAHMTEMKLCESFPDIPRETLLEILAAHDNNYGETVELLRSSMDSDQQPVTLNQNQLLERAMLENEVLNSQTDAQRVEQSTQSNNYSTHSSDDVGLVRSRFKSAALQPDEAKRLALRDFEETRNLAAHHCQLKAECYQKAKEAIQKGNSAVAVYYSQIANLHRKKIDMYNHRAANCIMDVHKYTQNNPDLLDLHYLHVLEAVGCLDLFLDQHITCLRSASRSYKHVFIITGRGLHSAGGVSTIKNKVKSRLKERNLRWSEVNPGLLKVKIFSASRHFKNI